MIFREVRPGEKGGRAFVPAPGDGEIQSDMQILGPGREKQRASWATAQLEMGTAIAVHITTAILPVKRDKCVVTLLETFDVILDPCTINWPAP